jgi:hypothetical protein
MQNLRGRRKSSGIYREERKRQLVKSAKLGGQLPGLRQCDDCSMVADPTDATENHLRFHEDLVTDVKALQVRHCLSRWQLEADNYADNCPRIPRSKVHETWAGIGEQRPARAEARPTAMVTIGFRSRTGGIDERDIVVYKRHTGLPSFQSKLLSQPSNV